MGLLPDYSNQARTYDATRGASPSLLVPLRAALAGAPGVELADVGGGTGNYALALAGAGWRPLVIDRSAAMLERAGAKGLKTLLADAERLPLADASFDAAVMIAVLHHVERAELAVAEARRILRTGGRLAIVAFTREDAADLWLLDYFPSAAPWMAATHRSRAELLALLPGATASTIVIADHADGCLAGLASDPALVLEPFWRSQTSFFERLERDDPADLAAGLERLTRDVAADRAPRRPGRATLLAWHS